MKKKLFILLAIATTLIMSFGFSSCSSSDDDNDPKFQDITLTAGTTKDLSYGKDFDWKSENDFIATITNGQINAKRIGTVKMVSEKGSFNVNVTPQYNYFEEPYINFGASIQDVKSAMKGHTLMNEDSKYLAYKGSGYTQIIMFSFENSKLKYSYIVTNSSYATQVANWTAERYVYVTDTDDYIGMTSVDLKTLVFITPMKISGTWYYTIGYAKYEKSSNAKQYKSRTMNIDSNNIDNTEFIVNQLKSSLK